MVCCCCRQAIHPDQAEPSALVEISQRGDRRAYQICGECCRRVEAQFNRGHRLPFPDPPLVTITRTGPRPA